MLLLTLLLLLSWLLIFFLFCVHIVPVALDVTVCIHTVPDDPATTVGNAMLRAHVHMLLLPCVLLLLLS